MEQEGQRALLSWWLLFHFNVLLIASCCVEKKTIVRSIFDSKIAHAFVYVPLLKGGSSYTIENAILWSRLNSYSIRTIRFQQNILWALFYSFKRKARSAQLLEEFKHLIRWPIKNSSAKSLESLTYMHSCPKKTQTEQIKRI